MKMERMKTRQVSQRKLYWKQVRTIKAYISNHTRRVGLQWPKYECANKDNDNCPNNISSYVQL